MATKTLTITEDAYDLLAQNKLENESFSQEIRRVLAKRQKKSPFDFFGILTEQEGERVEQVINKRREFNRRMKETKYT